MRLKIEIDDLSPEQWRYFQESLQARYEIPDGVSRACLTVIHGDEERHVELPASRVSGLLMGTNLATTFFQLGKSVKLAMAALTPDDARLPGAPCSPACEDQDDDRPHLLDCPVRTIDLSKCKCKCGFRAPELGPHPMCPVHK